MANQQDVAKRAGVSFITVSRVVNNMGNVKEETRQRVLEAIKDLNYHPNQAARALNNSRLRTIGVIWTLPFYQDIATEIYLSKLLIGFEAACFDNNYDLLISKMQEGVDVLALYYQRKVDGLVLAVAPLTDKQAEDVRRDSIPCCSLSENRGFEGVGYIDADNENGMYDGTCRLIEAGHKKIAFIGYPQEHLNIGDRYAGFLRALSDAGLEFDERYYFTGEIRIETGEAVVREIASMDDPPTAVVCSTDNTAVGVVKGAKREGVIVPDELSVISFDGFAEGQLIEPPLASVSQPVSKMAYEAIVQLISRIETGEFTKSHIIYPVTSIKGETIAPPKNTKKI